MGLRVSVWGLVHDLQRPPLGIVFHISITLFLNFDLFKISDISRLYRSRDPFKSGLIHKHIVKRIVKISDISRLYRYPSKSGLRTNTVHKHILICDISVRAV
jgi:hypothetical protein